MASRVNFKFKGDDLKGIENLKENIAKMANLQARIGLFGGNYPGTSESIASVGKLHEFGSQQERTFTYKGMPVKISGVPARSWLRVPIKTKFNKIIMGKKFMRAYITTALADGKPEKPLQLVALNAWDTVQEAFATRGFGQWKPNMNKEYIQLKGSTTPLIDTGLLKNSVAFKVVKRGES